MPNHLANESSPYLLQHANNPVEWYPWGEEALQRARKEDKPILLSIGYAACHWCHVMAHESFEDPKTAELMNEYFINIKVDREERPDIDSIYMAAVVAMTGQGGWPMTVIMTPDGRPFFGGTYFPPVPRHGMPAFTQLLQGIVQAWYTQRDVVERSAVEITSHLRQAAVPITVDAVLGDDLFEQALSNLLRTFDSTFGGFGPAPKFPPSMTLEFLLRVYLQRQDSMALHMAETTLKVMAEGGMYDQVGGGFARYSIDERWLVPHFEKMLYDNALLARVYLHAWQMTGNPLYRRITEETLDFVARELRHESGGFYSSYDADSEGEEGKFYIWTAGEIQHELGENAALFSAYYDVSKSGNWEGQSILNVSQTTAEIAQQFGLDEAEVERRLAAARKHLYQVRTRRVWPGLDDKVLTAWNGLMLAAFAEAGVALGRPDYTQIAEQNAGFLYDHMRREDGRLLRAWKAGTEARFNGYLEDYAYLADGLLALYQTTFEPRWFAWAQELADRMITHFTDETGGFFDTSDDHEDLLHRPKDLQDNATPSGNAMAVGVLLKLSLLTGEGGYWDIAEQATAGLYEMMAHYPGSFAQWLCNATFILGQPQEVAIVGAVDEAGTQDLLAVLHEAYRPMMVAALAADPDTAVLIPLLDQRPQIDGRPTAYVCRQFVCQQPVTDPAVLREQLAA
ncbi:MAG: thioredoxin domain-containing protein [Chloroflexota bacterium]